MLLWGGYDETHGMFTTMAVRLKDIRIQATFAFREQESMHVGEITGTAEFHQPIAE